jgi:hypothetical protein
MRGALVEAMSANESRDGIFDHHTEQAFAHPAPPALGSVSPISFPGVQRSVYFGGSDFVAMNTEG